MTTTEVKPATSPDEVIDASAAESTAAPEPATAEPAAAGSIKVEPAAAEAVQAPAMPAQTMRSEPVKDASATPEPVRTRAAEPAPAADPIRIEPARNPTPRADTATPPRLAPAAARVDSRLAALAGGALALGALIGFGVASISSSSDHGSAAAIASLAAAVDSGRSDTAKLSAALAKLDQSVAELRTASEAARRESTKGSNVTERIAQLDRSLTARITGLGERLDQAERERTARIAASAPRPVAKAEPTQTGSLAEPRDVKANEPKAVEAKAIEVKPAEPKPAEVKQADARQPEQTKAVAPAKPPVLANYALRDIFEGAAIIENRGRRLFQVVPGDTLPGAGRVEAIERRGHTWVVVTRQGFVTPQEW